MKLNGGKDELKHKKA